MADGTWLQNIGLDNLLRAFVPISAAIGGVWGAWKFGAVRSDQHGERAETRQERIQKELDAQQAAMSKQGQEALAWMREEATRARQRVQEVETERDEAYQHADAAWDIARGWKERCHRVRHDLENARTTVNSLLIQSNREPRDWPDERLPPLDQILEDNARRSAERRSIYAPRPDEGSDTL